MDRALEHVKQLDTWYDEWIKTEPYALAREYNSEGGAKRLYFTITNPVPLTCGVILGDIIHNARSALDHLAGAVAVKNGRTTKGVYFPVAPSAADLPRMIKDKLGKCPKPFRDFVAGHKPHKGGNDALYALHQLDILDKHQVIVPSGVGADIRIWADNGFYGAIDFSKTTEAVKVPRPKDRPFIEDGETIVEFGPAFHLPDKTKVEARVSPAVVFGGETPVAGRELKTALQEMMEAAEAVIAQAEPLFLR